MGEDDLSLPDPPTPLPFGSNNPSLFIVGHNPAALGKLLRHDKRGRRDEEEEEVVEVREGRGGGLPYD